MGKPHRRQREYTAGAYLNPFNVPIAARPRTLSDEYDDTAPPEETDEVPEPEPPSRVRRVLDRVLHQQVR